jgi:membrane protease YdiL (CAAX protease family)
MAKTSFRRGPHLAIAVVSLAYAPLVIWAMVEARRLFAEQSGVPASYAIGSLVGMCFAASCAWLAFAVLDTRAEVTLAPSGWRSAYWRPIVVFLVVEAFIASWFLGATPAELEDLRDDLFEVYVADGTLLVGWLVLAQLVACLAEELVHRALLLRGLEGYMKRPIDALAVQAIVFELTHVLGYGMAFSGGVWFVAGLVYGYAFQVTRSVLVPTVMHLAHNLGLTVVVWLLTT